jgi:hypothetical protein
LLALSSPMRRLLPPATMTPARRFALIAGLPFAPFPASLKW